jgi:lipopolysaccharide heptosyltransferase II
VIAARRILIVLHGAIGDVVRALPLLNRLRRACPDARIAWAVEPIAAPLLADHPALDERIVFDRPRGAPAFVEFLGRVRRYRADLTLDLQRHLKSGVVSRVSGAPVRVGFHRRNTNEGNWLFNNRYLPPVPHLSSKLEHYLLFADRLGLPASAVEFRLRAGAAEEAAADSLLAGVGRPFAVLFVGSTWESKTWLPEPTAATAEGLARRGLGVVLVGSPAEAPIAAEVARRARAPLVDLAGKTTLRVLIAVFGRAALALGPDSGPMHVAAAVGTPVVSLFGATSPGRSAPYGFAALVVRGPAPCSPCYLRRCPIGRLCMQRITPAMVLEQAEAALALAPPRTGGGAAT